MCWRRAFFEFCDGHSRGRGRQVVAAFGVTILLARRGAHSTAAKRSGFASVSRRRPLKRRDAALARLAKVGEFCKARFHRSDVRGVVHDTAGAHKRRRRSLHREVESLGVQASKLRARFQQRFLNKMRGCDGVPLGTEASRAERVSSRSSGGSSSSRDDGSRERRRGRGRLHRQSRR
jgi:hypothetical protein